MEGRRTEFRSLRERRSRIHVSAGEDWVMWKWERKKMEEWYPIYLPGGNSNNSYFHPYLGKWSVLTHIFQRGWKSPTRYGIVMHTVFVLMTSCIDKAWWKFVTFTMTIWFLYYFRWPSKNQYLPNSATHQPTSQDQSGSKVQTLEGLCLSECSRSLLRKCNRSIKKDVSTAHIESDLWTLSQS